MLKINKHSSSTQPGVSHPQRHKHPQSESEQSRPRSQEAAIKKQIKNNRQTYSSIRNTLKANDYINIHHGNYNVALEEKKWDGI